MTVKVAVVGAGLAGVTAARSLTKAGMDVTVFDRGRVVGGRCASRWTAAGSFDHGAQYFTVRDRRFGTLVHELTDQGIVAPWDVRVVDINGDQMTPHNPKTRYVAIPTMRNLVVHLATTLNLKLETVISTVRRAGRGWQLVVDGAAELGDYDALILAMPPEQASRLLPPEHMFQNRLQQSRSVTCWASMLVFDDPLDLPWDAAFFHNTDIIWAARDTSKPKRPDGERWIIHAAEMWSSQRFEAEPDRVAVELTDLFLDNAGLQTVMPSLSIAHRWGFARVATGVGGGILWDADARLAVCGDWSSNARVEGAYLSGLDAAAAVIKGSTGGVAKTGVFC